MLETDKRTNIGGIIYNVHLLGVWPTRTVNGKLPDPVTLRPNRYTSVINAWTRYFEVSLFRKTGALGTRVWYDRNVISGDINQFTATISFIVLNLFARRTESLSRNY